MKKLLLISSVLILFSACAQAPAPQDANADNNYSKITLPVPKTIDKAPVEEKVATTENKVSIPLPPANFKPTTTTTSTSTSKLKLPSLPTPSSSTTTTTTSTLKPAASTTTNSASSIKLPIPPSALPKVE